MKSIFAFVLVLILATFSQAAEPAKTLPKEAPVVVVTAQPVKAAVKAVRTAPTRLFNFFRGRSKATCTGPNCRG